MSVLCSRVGVLLMIAAADASCQLGLPSRPRQQQTFRIIKHDWTSHQLVSEVAAILLEEVLMYDIDRVTPRKSPVHDFRAVSMGNADANFEVWQGGKDEQIRKWARDGRAIVAGHHRVSGVSGIFTLKHTVDRFPQAEFHQNLGSPELHWLGAGNASVAGELAADPANLCSRAEWQCKNHTWLSPSCRHDPVNCVGQVLHDYSHYTQGILEQQIANNNLPLSVTYLTPTSKEALVWEAFASKRDVLFQHYTPSPGVDGVPAGSLVPVQFPPKRYGCNFTQTATPTGSFACHLEGQQLVSVISPAFQSSPEAAHFAAHFSLEKEDYEKLFEVWKDVGEPNLAACKWLKEVGISRWGRWIKFSSDRPIPMFREFPPTYGCFPTCYAFLLLTLGTALIFKNPDLVERVMKRLRALTAPGQPELDALQFRDLEKPAQEAFFGSLPSKMSFMSVCRHMDFVQVKMALQREMGFLGFFRDEHNFCRENGEGTVPPPAHSGYRQYCHTPGEVVIYFLTSGLVRMSLSAITYACATGVVGALLAEVQSTRRQEQAFYPFMEEAGGYEQFLANLRRVTGTMDEFKFLPTFFITYMVGQDVSRWLQWLRTMFSVQGRLHDVTLVVASSYRQLNDPAAGKIQRQRLFRWYRYLNAIHYLAYFKLDARVAKSPDQVLMELRSVGLLLDGEAQQLLFASTKIRDTLVSWLGALWHEDLAADSVQFADTEIFMRKLCDLRGILASLADMPDMQTSQLMRVMMIVVTNILLALALVGYPTKMYAETEQCFQFWPLVASCLYFICFRGMLRVMFILDKGPFFNNGDCVNVDALLTSTERFTFHVFRTSFKPLKPEHKAIQPHRIGVLDDKLPPAAASKQVSN